MYCIQFNKKRRIWKWCMYKMHCTISDLWCIPKLNAVQKNNGLFFPFGFTAPFLLFTLFYYVSLSVKLSTEYWKNVCLFQTFCFVSSKPFANRVYTLLRCTAVFRSHQQIHSVWERSCSASVIQATYKCMNETKALQVCSSGSMRFYG